MKTRSTLLTLAVVVAASAAAFAASAQIFNPDNDSAAAFRYRADATPAAPAPAAAPQIGDRSGDGLYVYSGTDRGWVNRPHSYAMHGGTMAHTADCVPYNLPAPTAAYVPAPTKGAFAEHGA